MKYRIDFVTNSSSSSFVVEKDLEFELTEEQWKKIKDCDLSFYYMKEDGGEWGFKENKERAPKIFKDYAKRMYLYEDKKIGITNILNSKGTRDRFLDYLNKKYVTDVDPSQLRLVEERYEKGYGESLGNDFINENEYLVSCLHPVLKTDLKKSSFCIYDEGKNFWFGDYCIHKIKESVGKDTFYYYEFCDLSLGLNHTKAFFTYIFDAYSRPELSVPEFRQNLKKHGLTESEITSLEKKDIQILYACNKSKKNDIVVYMEKGKPDLQIVPFHKFKKSIHAL